jgi:type I restriction enzyme S subunit
MTIPWPEVPFSEFLIPNSRPYRLGPTEDANLVGMRWYGMGPFHRELKPAMKIAKKSHFVIKAGDVIYNKLFAWKGTLGVVPIELDGMFVSDKFPTYELDRTQVDERFLMWYFRLPSLWEQARLLSTGSAAVSKLTLNPSKFLFLTMPLPSLPEQRLLVNQIDALSDSIEEALAMRREALTDRHSLFATVITAAVEAVDVEGRLGDVLLGKPRNGWSAPCTNADDGIPVLSLGAVTGFEYRPTQFKRTSEPTSKEAHYWLHDGDLLITRSNTPELVGHAAIYSGSPFPCIYPDLIMRIIVDEKRAEKSFVHRWLMTKTVREYIRTAAKGTSPTMKKISQDTVMDIPFPSRLSIEEQRRILAYIDDMKFNINTVAELQQESIEELNALMPSVLSRAFSGEL